MSSKFSSLLKKTLAVAAAAAWLIVPAVLLNQQTMVYAAEARAVSQNVLANTENGQVRGLCQGVVCATGGGFPTPSRRSVSCVGGRR